MSPFLLKEAVRPFEDELNDFKINLSKVSNLQCKYNGEDIAFVDIVVEGGGVKGVAVSGAIYALERLGLRFRKIGGTSAGAINAIYLAALGDNIAEKKAERLANIVFNMDLLRFVDGGKAAQAFVKAIMNDKHSFFSKINQVLTITRNLEPLYKNFGINPGMTIHRWLRKNLKMLNNGKEMTVSDLKQKLRNGPFGIQGDFQLIVTDITNRRKAEFPRELPLYFKKHDEILVADIVRSSLALPFFFEPFNIAKYSYLGELETESDLIVNPNTIFIDGALTSNFPLGIFDVDKLKIPKCPTFGILFDNTNEVESKNVHSVFDYMLAMIETLNDYGDRAYLFHHESASRMIKISNVVDNRKIKTIYFNLNKHEMITLFGNGVRAALDFIKTWDFQNYITKIRKRES